MDKKNKIKDEKSPSCKCTHTFNEHNKRTRNNGLTGCDECDCGKFKKDEKSPSCISCFKHFSPQRNKTSKTQFCSNCLTLLGSGNKPNWKQIEYSILRNRNQTLAQVEEKLKLRIRKNLRGMDVVSNFDSWYNAETLSEADVEEEIKNLKSQESGWLSTHGLDSAGSIPAPDVHNLKGVGKK